MIDGAENLLGRRVFSLYPHQDLYVMPAKSVVPVPDGVSTERAVLAANMETAVNALWDAPPRLGSRVAVIGFGVVGALVGCLAARTPGVQLEVVDINPAKAALAGGLGLSFVMPDKASADVDLVIHASGHGEGLETALRIAGFEATILDLSWYGERRVTLPLGESFHSRRLKLISSQVGTVAASMRARWTYRDRLALALRLLDDARMDALLSEPRPFEALPAIMTDLARAENTTMCQLVTYR